MTDEFDEDKFRIAICAFNNVPTDHALSEHQRSPNTRAAWMRVFNAIAADERRKAAAIASREIEKYQEIENHTHQAIRRALSNIAAAIEAREADGC